MAFVETLQHRTQEVNNAQHIYDMIVVGGGPGGYTRSPLCRQSRYEHRGFREVVRWWADGSDRQIDNYPGFEDGIDGFSLGEKMKRGTERFGVETKLTEVLSLELSGSIKKAVTSEGPMYAKTIVLATGAGPRELGVDGEQELIGKVSTTAQPVTECSIGTKRLSSQEVAIPLRRMPLSSPVSAKSHRRSPERYLKSNKDLP